MKHIYIFVNPESGGRNAWKFIEPSIELVQFGKPIPLTVHIYSIYDGESGNKPGFKNLKQYLENDNPEDYVRVITAGGDGTLTWVISEVERHMINPDLLIFGIIPYGTGNDFARAVKWHTYRNFKPFADNLRPLRAYFNKLLSSSPGSHDFWTIHISVHPGGKFNKINSKSRKKEDILDGSGTCVETMKFMMGNYFSVGTESRVGRGFDRHRTRYSCFNKTRYVIESLKKAIMGQISVNKQIDRMVSGEKFDNVVFVTDFNEKKLPVLRKSVSLLAGNIPSFSSGADPFSLATRLGLMNLNKGDSIELLNSNQVMGDKKLEFCSYKSLMDIGMDHMNFGMSMRVHVGEGPWKILFKELPKEEKCYFQVDGEFFVMFQPKEVEIRHYMTINVVK